jgi:TolB protein
MLVSDTFTSQLLPFFDQYALSHRLWSADGATVVIPVASDDGTDRLVAVAADGSGARPVTDGVVGFWSP